jgi:hypothetical protein
LFRETRYSRQNSLSRALREIGRVERSLFMLDWLDDIDLRRRTNANLNKGATGGPERRTTAQDVPSPGDERGPVYCIERWGMADDAQMLPAGLDGARVFLRVAQQRSARRDQPHSGDGSTPAGGPGGIAQRRSNRQSVSQNMG